MYASAARQSPLEDLNPTAGVSISDRDSKLSVLLSADIPLTADDDAEGRMGP